MAANTMVLMQKLRESQERVRDLEGRCGSLIEENRELRAELTQARSSPAADASTQLAISEENRANDAIIAELRAQLTDALKRNVALEKEAHEGHSRLRRQFEEHSSRVELELRRARAGKADGNRPVSSPRSENRRTML